MNKSWLPAGGANVFQLIKKVREDARLRGVEILDLSIGQPTGPALHRARKVCAIAVMSEKQEMHEYQDNGCLPRPGFAQAFSQAHVKADLSKFEGLSFLPIPGIKPMLPLIPLSCGAEVEVQGMTNPGYQVPETWSRYLGRKYSWLHTSRENEFLFHPEEVKPDGLVMMNYPHNPSGQISPREWLEALCRQCSENGVRLFNDAAYTILAGVDHCTLTDVAVNFPSLSWAEAFSPSKAGNFTGWRAGAIVGSSDFVGDIAKIKGNTDSGAFAPAMLGVLAAFESNEGRREIQDVSETYAYRIALLTSVLASAGMQLVVEPKAGFFTLWTSPRWAFGQEVRDSAHFNELMINETGIVGVQFGPYIRYAVVGDIAAMLSRIEAGFKKAKVSY